MTPLAAAVESPEILVDSCGRLGTGFNVLLKGSSSTSQYDHRHSICIYAPGQAVYQAVDVDKETRNERNSHRALTAST